MQYTDLHVDNFFGPQLSQQGLQFRATDVVLERAETEFGSRTVQNTDTKHVGGFGTTVIVAIFGFSFPYRDAVPSLLIYEERIVD